MNSEKLNRYYYKVFFINSPQYKGISIANLVLGVLLEWTTEYVNKSIIDCLTGVYGKLSPLVCKNKPLRTSPLRSILVQTSGRNFPYTTVRGREPGRTLHGLFESICRSGVNPKKVLHIRGGAMQVYHHNQ